MDGWETIEKDSINKKEFYEDSGWNFLDKEELKERETYNPYEHKHEDYSHSQLEQNKTNAKKYTAKEGFKVQSPVLHNTATVMEAFSNTAYEVVKSNKINEQYVKLNTGRKKLLIADSEKNRNGVEEIVEFSMAGSSFKEYRKEHQDIHGKGDFAENKREALDYTDAQGNVEKVNYVKWGFWDKCKSLTKAALKFEYFGNNEYKQKSIQHEKYEAAKAAKLDQLLGPSQELKVDGENAKKFKHIRKKEKTINNVKVSKITIAGALPVSGLVNAGEHSIENNRNYMYLMAKPKIDEWIEKYRNDIHPKELRFQIRGHSRGGVAATQGAMLIKQYFLDATKHDQKARINLLNYLKFDLVLYDPVPGAGSDKSVNHMVDLKNQTKDMKANNMASLDSNVSSTLIYSIHSDHKAFFTPQIVKGADRIILTPFNHAVGLDGGEETIESVDGAIKTQIHASNFTDTKTGEKYRGFGINSAPKGLYVCDENGRLLRMTSAKQATNFVKDLLAINKVTNYQKDRHEVIYQVIRDYFSNN